MKRPPLRDRTILYLMRFVGYEDEVEVPHGLTQKGMARAIGVKRAQVAQVLGELKGKDMVRERVCHVKGSPRRLKVYFLKVYGRTLGEKLRKSILERKLRFTDESGETKEMTVKEVLALYKRRLDITTLLRLIDQRGSCDHSKIMLKLESSEEEMPEVPVKAEEEEPAFVEEPVEEQEVESTDPWTLYYQGKGPLPTTTTEGLDDTAETTHEAAGDGDDDKTEKSAVPVPPVRPRKVSRISFVLGNIFILLSIILPIFLIYELGEIMCMWSLFFLIFGIILVVYYYISFRRAGVEKLEKIDRRMIILVSMIMSFVLAIIAAAAFGTKWNDEDIRLVVAILAPLVFVLLAGFMIPVHVRGQIGLVVGTFLIALSMGAMVSLEAFPWLGVHPVMWLAIGVMAAIVGMEVARPKNWDIGLGVSSGFGIFISVMASALIYNVYTADPADAIIKIEPNAIAGVLALWFILGVVVAFVRFAHKTKIEILYQGLGITAIVSVGLAFVLFGIWLLKLVSFEGVVDIVVGLPVLWYGFDKLKGRNKEFLRTVGVMLAYGIILQILTLGLVLDFF